MIEISDVTAEPLSFRQRVQEFWQLFGEYEETLRDLIQNEPQEAYQYMQRLLQVLFAAPVFDLEQQEERFCLTVSPEGDGGRLYELAYWREQADISLESYWDFLIGRMPAEELEGLEVAVNDVVVSPSSIRIWPILLEDGRLGLECFSQDLLTLEANVGYMLLCGLLEQCVGELCLMTHIEYVNLSEKPGPGQGLLMSQLADYLAQLQMEGRLPPEDDPLALYTDYDMLPQEGPWALREDIFAGNVSAPALPVLTSYYVGSPELFQAARQDGVIWCMLFFSCTEIAEAQRIHVRTALEEELGQLLLEQALGVCVGGASGYQYAYLDWICFDWNTFLQTAQTVMERYVELYQVQTAGVAELQRNGRVIFWQFEGRKI